MSSPEKGAGLPVLGQNGESVADSPPESARLTRVGPYVMIIDTEFHDHYDRNRMPDPRPVVIEEDVWIGAKASILPGVTIGRGAIVGVAAVVTKSVPAYTVVGGVPARELKKLDPERMGSG